MLGANSFTYKRITFWLFFFNGDIIFTLVNKKYFACMNIPGNIEF
jgi:hypothetical protein